MRTAITTARLSIAVLAMSAFAACSGGGGDAGDTAAATSTTASAGTATAGDSMAGMDHSNMPGMSSTPAKDADQEFLRMMVDHHEGLTEMLDPALQKASSQTAKADAKKVHDKQHQEQEQMLGMLKTSYDETKMPMVMPSNQPMVDDLKNSPSNAAYDKKMYGHIVMHHQEGIKMIDQFLPRLTKPELKQMAEKMRADQQKEIQEFQRKAAA
jgi:uncharacterized protein (DUF305 family)